MAMAVITVSRQMGSLGTEMAQVLAKRLEYEYVDKEKIGEALKTLGIPEPEVERFDEKRPPFWDFWQIQRKKYLHFLEAVIYDFARKGKKVIVGRGGQVLLKQLPGVLHLRVIAPLEVRIKRIADERHDEREAARLLRRNDRESEGFIRSFFEANWDDPGLYDLVINTQKISLEKAVDLVLQALQSREIVEGEKKADEKLAEMALIQKVEAVLIDVLGVDVRHINTQVEKGIVTLRGSVSSAKDREGCEKAVGAIEGIRKVESQLLVEEYYRFGS